MSDEYRKGFKSQYQQMLHVQTQNINVVHKCNKLSIQETIAGTALSVVEKQRTKC